MEVCKEELKAALFWSRCVDYVSSSFCQLEKDKNELSMIFLCFITFMIEHSTRNFPCHIKIYFAYDVPVHEHIIRELLTIEHGFESVEIKCKQKFTCSYYGNRRAKTYSPLSFSIFVYCSVSSLLGIRFRTSHVRMFLLLDAIFFSILKLTFFF